MKEWRAFGPSRRWFSALGRQLYDDHRAGVLTRVFCPSLFGARFSFFPLLQRDHARVTELSNRLLQGIYSQVEQVVRNGDVNGYPGCLNLSFAYVEGESLLMALKV